MATKPTYEELEQRVKALENEKEKWLIDKIESKVDQEIEVPELELGDIINTEEIQSIMDDFCYLTNMVTAILDLKGKVIEATGWQDICTKFHRINPTTALHCTQSDLFLAKQLKPGEHAEYKCKNGLWDVVTPLYVGTKHLGNIYTGQFFYDDEQIDEKIFIKQAGQYEFEKDSYLEAFHRIPRYSRETINHLMSFLVKFTTYISRISLLNIQLEKEIRERTQAEEALKESETHLRTLLRTIPDLVWLKDQRGRYLVCNARFEKFFGAVEKDIIGKTDYDFIDKRLADFFREQDETVMMKGVPVRSEVEVTFADDGYHAILETIKTPMKRSDGQFTGVLGIGRDITERKRAEEALKKSKEYSEKLIESANAMIVVLDADGRIQVFNKFAEQITGYTRQELIDRSWFEVLVPKNKYPDVWEVFLKTWNEGIPCTFENPIVTKSGEERFISWQNTELWEDDVFLGSISYGIDITESKRLQKQLLQSQRMEAVGQLTGGIAHDFNNMLSVILGHAELIKSDLPLGDPLLKSVLEIENAGLHSRDITRQLLAFSRKQIIAPKTINLNHLIANIKTTLAKLIGENIDLRFLGQRDLWNVRIDPSQVDQILFNLAGNARDAMPDGGVLTIETSNINLDEVYCASNLECRPGPYVMLSVADNGVGIEKETLSHVFEPFYTTKEMGKGTGLGLATVYGIVKQNGGFIHIYSEPGKGTTLKIHIPRLMDEIEIEATVEEALPEIYPATVLLVEDDDMVRRMTAALLKRIGYSVLIAESPHEALEFFKQEDTPIDLLVTDVIMPQMSGVELVAKIRLIKRDIKVLFMSGYTENVIVHQGVLKEGIHFIQKPFSKNDFARKVRDAIEDKYV